jgi:hypothetical protein
MRSSAVRLGMAWITRSRPSAGSTAATLQRRAGLVVAEEEHRRLPLGMGGFLDCDRLARRARA